MMTFEQAGKSTYVHTYVQAGVNAIATRDRNRKTIHNPQSQIQPSASATAAEKEPAA